MNLSKAVRNFMSGVGGTDIVITSTGYISREVYRTKDRPLNFYMMGSMGSALAIGIGVAKSYQGRVIVLNGDGAALMSLGTMVTADSLHLHNLHHVIFDNKCHASTGGQKTASDSIVWCCLGKVQVIYVDRSGRKPPRIPLSPGQITERFMNAIKAVGNK